MKKFIKIIAIIILALALYSFAPVIGLYLSKSPVPYSNAEAVKKLETNKGSYFSFIVFGDNHAGLVLDDSSTLKMAGRMNGEIRFRKIPIDLVISCGDITFKGSAFDYSMFNKLRARIKFPVISALGNHDDDYDKGDSYTMFKKYVGQDELSFVNRNSYFIIANNVEGSLTENQFSWLEKELMRSASYDHRFIIMHKPPIAPYQQSWYRPEQNPWSTRFMKLCEKYKVDIVFCGHEHMYKEKVFNGVRYIVSGGGGMITWAPSNDGGYLHYLVVKVYGDYVDYEVRRISPPIWEIFTYYMWKDLFYFLKNIL